MVVALFAPPLEAWIRWVAPFHALTDHNVPEAQLLLETRSTCRSSARTAGTFFIFRKSKAQHTNKTSKTNIPRPRSEMRQDAEYDVKIY